MPRCRVRHCYPACACLLSLHCYQADACIALGGSTGPLYNLNKGLPAAVASIFTILVGFPAEAAEVHPTTPSSYRTLPVKSCWPGQLNALRGSADSSTHIPANLCQNPTPMFKFQTDCQVPYPAVNQDRDSSPLVLQGLGACAAPALRRTARRRSSSACRQPSASAGAPSTAPAPCSAATTPCAGTRSPTAAGAHRWVSFLGWPYLWRAPRLH